MPKAAPSTLAWSETSEQYYWRQQNGLPPLSIEDRLQEHLNGISFAFQGRAGHLTVRKELRQHGEGYWYAYRSHGGKTLKRYAGRDSDLTIARLEMIASAFLSGDREDRDQSQRPEQRLLLAPKLRPPRLHSSLIAREHLLKLLDTALESKLTLLSAPAGFGKTTLVSQWIASRTMQTASAITHTTKQPFPPIAWVALDAGDNDVARFWHYVISACQTFRADIGQESLTLLYSGQPPGLNICPLHDVLTPLLNELSIGAVEGVLILEDYHLITSPFIHEGMTFLLEHLPPSIHLVITTRVDPPFPLMRMRAHQELRELQAADLRFSQEETGRFLEGILPCTLTPELLQQLDSQMEGWVAGLHLLALTLHNRVGNPQVLQNLRGNQRHILEFFVTEVLNAQSESLQQFLLQTSILPRLTASLCNAVTGLPESAELLKKVEQANLFLLPLDDIGEWYRYHMLFAEAMQHEARSRLGEEALQACYQRASLWYEQQQLFFEAIEASLQAQDFTRTALLIERFVDGLQFYEIYEHQTFCRWLSALPEPLLQEHPELASLFALMLMFSVDCTTVTEQERVTHLLWLAERAYQASNDCNGLGKVYAIQALLYKLQHQLPRAIELAQQSLNTLPGDAHQWRGTALGIIGEKELVEGHLNQARQTILQAHAAHEASGNVYASRASLLSMGSACFLQGELHQSTELYRQVLLTAGRDIEDKKKALLGLARIAYEWNDLALAEQHGQEALKLTSRSADDIVMIHIVCLLADIQFVRGRREEALQMVQELLARRSSIRNPVFQIQLLVAQARLQLACGNFAAVERWASTRSLPQETPIRLLLEQEELLLARFMIAQHHHEAALALLEIWLNDARQYGRTRSEISILVLMALASPDNPEPLRTALLQAHNEGFLRIFLDEGPEVYPLLRTVLPSLKQEIPLTYARKLFLSKLQTSTDAPDSTIASSMLLNELLSPQEQRVLRLLVAGHSNTEIAISLIVSINTVKTQVRSIFRKLNASSRKEARIIAREAGLL